MDATRYDAETRRRHLADLASGEPLDVLVVGGGVTGAGTALDAAARGLRTGLLEAEDFASGTSQWSSKLVHGGLRYLYQLDFPLVAEALRERGRLLSTLAPHLVRAQPFLWPLRTPVIERAYSAVGVGMYDALARIGAKGEATVPLQKHHSRRGALELFPDLRPDSLTGAIRFYDARVDDARLVLALVRTAVGKGAKVASRTRVTGFLKDDDGRVAGVEAVDTETGETLRIRAREVVSAAGVWTEELQGLAGGERGLKVLASKGIHIVVPKERIKGSTGMFLRTEKSVLFIIPWDRYWVIGTTDTPWTEERRHPVATAADVDYVLEHANSVLAKPLTRADIIGVYAGLRPLLQPGVTGDSSKASTKISREHTVTRVVPGLTAVAGGKLTTYRVMASDAVDFAIGKEQAAARPSVTADLPLIGAEGFAAARAGATRLAAQRGWDPERVEHLLARYGAELPEVLATIDADPDLGRPLEVAPAYLRAEVAFAVTHEGALHVADVLARRVRLDMERRDRGVAALEEVGAIMAPLLGWDEATLALECDRYRSSVEAQAAAETVATDAEASALRLAAQDVRETV